MSTQRNEDTRTDADFWDLTYLDYPVRWGKFPSRTGQLAAQYSKKESTIVEVGPGAYPRDLIHIHNEIGCQDLRLVEEASRGREMCLERLTQEGITAANYKGNFLNLSLPPNSVNTLFAHRVIHLFTTDEDMQLFEQRCYECLRPGGLLILGARDLRERDAQMDDLVQKKPGIWEKKSRPGHFFRFWSTERYQEVFSARFTIKEFQEGDEPESHSEEGPSHRKAFYTVMVAEKRSVTIH